MEEQSKIGQYTLIRKIGHGGMAEVWEAQHLLLGMNSAVKFLLPDFASNKELQERFLNEGKRQAQLQHPNIVQATDFFQIDGRSFLVMKYIEGESLEERLKKPGKPLSLEEIRSISSDVLGALEYAHSLSVIHRDVKPANMLMDKAGRTLLTDFGIAKVLREERSATQTGTSMGTPDYMSPEQIVRPKDVDVRSDVYSVGCVLYAMLSGSPPFGSEGETVFLIQDRHMRMPPPPLVYQNSKVPGTVGPVVLKCLEKDPAKRFQSCAEVLTALQAALSGKQVLTDPRPAPGGFAKYALAGLAAVILIAALVYVPIAKKNHRLEMLKTKDWTHVAYNDLDFADCMSVAPCVTQAAYAADLKNVKDWKQQPNDSSFFKNCMNYQPCTDQKVLADKLATIKIPPKPPAIRKLQEDSDDPENQPSCCKLASNPAKCLSIKHNAGLKDCTSPTDGP